MDDIASLKFIGYAVYDFFIIISYFLITVYNGSEVNSTDFELREIMIGLSKDCIEIKTLCDGGKIWAKK